MKSSEVERAQAPSAGRNKLHGGHLRTLEALFRHPTAHNLEWMDIVGLLEKIGTVTRVGGDKFGFVIAEEHYVLHKPHTKDLPSTQVAELRQFLTRAGWSPGSAPEPIADPSQRVLTLVVVVDHHGAKIFRVDAVDDGASQREIKPYDPHHFLHHLAHKDQSREEGQRTAEDPSFYKRISEALAAGSRIVVIGHGAGKSNAAKHLTEYLRAHYRETYQRIVSELAADLSAVTTPQLLELAEQALGPTT
jgi:hypothetical protein